MHSLEASDDVTNYILDMGFSCILNFKGIEKTAATTLWCCGGLYSQPRQLSTTNILTHVSLSRLIIPD